MAKSRKKATEPEPPQPRVPRIGEHVRRPGTDTEYEITWVSPDDLRVHIGLPRTNFEHRNVDAAILTYLDEPIATAKPTKPVINAPEVIEHIAAVRHGVLDHLSGELAILKKYLKAKRVPADAGEELDKLCKEHEEAWKIIVAKIKELLGSNFPSMPQSTVVLLMEQYEAALTDAEALAPHRPGELGHARAASRHQRPARSI